MARINEDPNLVFDLHGFTNLCPRRDRNAWLSQETVNARLGVRGHGVLTH